MKRFLLLALCALFAGTAGARTLYVDARRPNNKGNGLSAAKAKKTIQAAINIAKKGDTIIVAPGSYAPIKTNNRKIRITALKGVDKTKIVKPATTGKKVALAQLGKAYKIYLDSSYKYTGSSGIWTKGTASTLEGFLLDGMNRAVGSYGELIGVSGGTVKGCRIQRLGKRYADTYGGFPWFDRAYIAVNARLTDCIVKNNMLEWLAPEEDMAVGSGGKPAAATGSTFTRCKINSNEGWQGFERATFYSCLLFDNTSQYDLLDQSMLVNCTVVKNIILGRSKTPSFSCKSKYYNCILWGNYVIPALEEKTTVWGYRYYDANGDYLGYRYADSDIITGVLMPDRNGTLSPFNVTEEVIASHYPGYTCEEDAVITPKPSRVKELHNVDSGNTYKNTDKTNKAPKFVNPVRNNFKLKKGSYAIDKGRLTSSQKKNLGTTDLAGGIRIKGKYVDRGCYEF